MLIRQGSGDFSSGRVARAISASTVVNRNGITSMGNVQDVAGASDAMPANLTSFVVNFVNGTGGALNYVLGDPTGIIRNLINPTTVPGDPTTAGGGVIVTGLQQSFGLAPVLVHGINYSATSGATQFPQSLQWCEADVNGNLTRNPIIVAEAQRNTAFNANLLTLRFGNPYRMDWNGCFFITVAAGQTVSWTVFVEAATNR